MWLEPPLHTGVAVLRLAAGRANPGAARNAGLAKCDSEYVQFLDADMILDPRWLQVAVSLLRREPRRAVRLRAHLGGP